MSDEIIMLALFAMFVILAAVAVFIVGMIVFEWYLPPDQTKREVERLIANANKTPRKRAF